MKLWLISQEVNTGYDTYDSAVVVAETEEAARTISPDSYRVWIEGKWYFKYSDGSTSPERSHGAWADPHNVKAEFVGDAAPHLKSGDRVCASFNAG